MSWLDDVVDFGKTAFNFVTGNSVGGSLARTALIGFALNKVNKSIQKSNDINIPDFSDNTSRTLVDIGQILQVDPDTEYRLPVLYGEATLGGVITDAWLTDNNQTMYFCVALAERTDTLLSTSSASTYVVNEVYYNDLRLVFDSNGTTVAYGIDREGNRDNSIDGLVEVYCFMGDSETPQVPSNYTNGSLADAYDIMPHWDSAHQMEDSLFAIVKVTYSRENGVIGMPNMQFTITNSMRLPGDVLYDYMTNTRYGAGIPSSNIGAS